MKDNVHPRDKNYIRSIYLKAPFYGGGSSWDTVLPDTAEEGVFVMR